MRAEKLKLIDWAVKSSNEFLKLTQNAYQLRIPKFEVFINEQFQLSCYVFGWRVPSETEFLRAFSLNEITVLLSPDVDAMMFVYFETKQYNSVQLM